MSQAIQPAPVRKTVTVKTGPGHAFEVFTAAGAPAPGGLGRISGGA